MWTVILIILCGLVITGVLAWKAPLVDENDNPVRGGPASRPGLSAIEFPEHTLVIAKNQPPYRPLPAYVGDSEQGEVITCWRLNWRDRLKLLFTGRLWASTLTFCMPLQPLYFTVDKSDVLRPVAAEPNDV